MIKNIMFHKPSVRQPFQDEMQIRCSTTDLRLPQAERKGKGGNN